ncbi:MAG: dTDP-4-dehydrorhamnose 3,5-epimerase [bacterium]
MIFTETELLGVWIIEPQVFEDKRGVFFESYREEEFREHIGPVHFIQENESSSVRGVLRGLHYQFTPHSQAKLVRVIQGEVYDVAVDLRRGSPTFSRYAGEILSGENYKQMFIPRGFAHGFLVLSDTCIFQYKVDNLWHRDSERALRFDDPEVGVEWPLDHDLLILSEKDRFSSSLERADVFTFGEEL